MAMTFGAASRASVGTTGSSSNDRVFSARAAARLDEGMAGWAGRAAAVEVCETAIERVDKSSDMNAS
jgi:hypothetical protein